MDLIKELKKSKLPLILYGAAEFSNHVKFILDWHNIKIDFVTVDKEYWREGMKFYDFEILPLEDVLAKNLEVNIVVAFISDDIKEKIEKLKKRANVKKCVIFDKQIVLRNISFYLRGGAKRSEKEEIDIVRNFIRTCDIYFQDEETSRKLANNWSGKINNPKNLRFIENAIPVVLCANDDFAPYLAVMLQSLLDKTNPQRKYHFIIFQRDFSLKTKECLSNQTSKFPNCAIDFFDVSCAAGEIPIPTMLPRFSVDMYSRLLIPYWLDKYKKVIYLDSDMIAKADIADLYDLDIFPFCIGAVIDPLGVCKKNKFCNFHLEIGGAFANLDNWSRYFNSGVLVFDTEKFREKISYRDLFRFAIYYSNRYKRRCNDQDVLNIIVKEDYFVLPSEYNDMWHYYDKNGQSKIRSAASKGKILHFTTSIKPWKLNSEIENNRDVISYRKYAETVKLFREYYDGEKRYFDFDKLNKKLKECKNVHFMYNDKFTNSTINFINEHFPVKDNLFLVDRTNADSFTSQKFPKEENVIEFDYGFLNPKYLKNKKLIFHSLNYSSTVNYLYKNKRLLEHSYWLVWGADLYDAPDDEANAFVRKNIYGIGSICDNALIMKKYGFRHVFFNTNLSISPVSQNLRHKPRKMRNENERVVIQINNSADESTLEMLDILSKYKNENILIKTVLSYRQVELRSKIIDKGADIFGDKFVFLDKIIPPDEYAEYLAQNDVLILYRNRWHAFDNLLLSLSLGVKVFVRFDTTTVTQFFLKSKLKSGFNFFDADKIKDMDFKEFCEISKEAVAGNIAFSELFFNDEEKKIKSFSAVLNHIPIKHRKKWLKPVNTYLMISVFLCDHCNQNCKHCVSYSPVAEKSFADLDILKRDFKRLLELANSKCAPFDLTLNLTGGEPLLHPKIIEIFDIAGEIFDTSTKIRLSTNGILLADQPDEFWESCNKNRIRICVSIYPAEINIEKIEKQAHKFDVDLTKCEREDIWTKKSFDFTGEQNLETAYINCTRGIILENGKFARCSMPFKTKHFNKYFIDGKVKYGEPSKKDFIDIFKIGSFNEIIEKFTRPSTYCRYCKAAEPAKWGLSERKIEEWI
ncbi:MAG: hypothetical protein FWF51_02135 [Chitinivibrionia bacterium]|nr:hypothetical protein [Chitinivibrionia bacterium]